MKILGLVVCVEEAAILDPGRCKQIKHWMIKMYELVYRLELPNSDQDIYTSDQS